jgi:eukaryotic-like serine/threonine-protein kinase
MSSIPQSFLVPSSGGEIITFYSYKGGTGRSMAVANIACLLSKRLSRTPRRVLVMDWDLEAPGLHRFFSAKSELPEYERRPGVINYFDDLRTSFRKEPGLYKKAIEPEG